MLNLQIAWTYLSATDPQISKRTRHTVMDEMGQTKCGPPKARHNRGMRDTAFDSIRNMPLLETQSHHFLQVLCVGTVSTNMFLVRLHNFALQMNWLPWPILAKKRWPEVTFNEKRAVTRAEHQAILAHENDPARRAFFECCWHSGCSDRHHEPDGGEYRLGESHRELPSPENRHALDCSIRGYAGARPAGVPRFGSRFPNLVDRPIPRFPAGLQTGEDIRRDAPLYRYAWAKRGEDLRLSRALRPRSARPSQQAVHRA